MKGLTLLRQRGHDVLVFHVLDDDELDFPFTGPTRFDGLESLDHSDVFRFFGFFFLLAATATALSTHGWSASASSSTSSGR